MKKKCLNKIFFITLVLFLCFYNMVSFASDFVPDNYKPNNNGGGSINAIGQRVFGVLTVVAISVAVVTISIIGIKILFGSVEQKAEYKAMMIPWVIGLAIVILIIPILRFIRTVAGTIGE